MEKRLIRYNGPSNPHLNGLFYYPVHSVSTSRYQLAKCPRSQVLAYETTGHLRMDHFRHVA
jgi:hypothetical protein